MALVRLSVLSLFFVSLAGSQPADDAGVQSTLASDLSFPWSRLRLPRYLSEYSFQMHKDEITKKKKKQETDALV